MLRTTAAIALVDRTRLRALALASLASLSLVAACAADPAPECATAVEKVAACYGEETAAAFAESCDADTAAIAVAEDCGGVEEGKADSTNTPILSPATEHFKYGSIGADKLGIPVAILKAVPLVCADTLPAGANPRQQPLAAFGMIYEPGKELPIGFSTRRLPLIGMQLAGTTCSTCHTATVRETASSVRTMYFGAPNQRFDVQGWNDFLLGCISDSRRFNATTLDRAFRELGITGFDRFLAFKSDFLRIFTADLKRKVESLVTDGAWGPGRDDAIGLSAAILLGEEHLPTIPAPIDYPAVWNQQARKGHSLHWDGASGSAVERNVLVSVGAGTPRNAVPLQSIAAIQSFLDQLPAPKYPYAIDQTLVPRGRQLFDQLCNSCHGPTGARLFQVTDLAELGTDPNRVDVVTQAGIDELNAMSGTGWQFDTFKKTNGYLNSLLDGIWLRAPYLHNGSVPTLRDLLKPATERPTTFFRGNDTFDKVDVGFVSNLASEGSTTFMRFETARAGNSNAGHEYGTNLSPADQDALLEYLKTL
jgi:mono/diheme cytochrome c family protein